MSFQGSPGETLAVAFVIGIALQELARELDGIGKAERLVVGGITPIGTRHHWILGHRTWRDAEALSLVLPDDING